MRFDCIHCRKATTKPQSVKGAFLRMLTELLIPNIGIQMFQQFDYLVRKYTKKEMSSKQLSSHANQILYKIVGLTEDEVLYVENFYPPIL